jgi:hypothetical protein
MRTWKCPQCGIVYDRDANAAQNILAVGLTVSAWRTGKTSNSFGSRRHRSVKQESAMALAYAESQRAELTCHPIQRRQFVVNLFHVFQQTDRSRQRSEH